MALQNYIERQEREKARADKTYLKQAHPLVYYYMPFVVDSVIPGGAASHGGIQKGDSVVGVNDIMNLCNMQIENEMRKHPCDSIIVDFYRENQLMRTHLFIGDHAMIAANTYVNKDVPPYVKAAHSPITYVGANFLGLRRRGFFNEGILCLCTCQDCYGADGFRWGVRRHRQLLVICWLAKILRLLWKLVLHFRRRFL